MSPYGSMYEEDGSLKPFPTDDARVANPLLANQVDRKFHQTQSLVSTLYGIVTLPYGITFQTNYNNRFGWRKQYYYEPSIKPGVKPGGRASRDEYSDYEWLIDNILKWNYTFSDIHNFDATFVASAEKYNFWNTYVFNEEFIPNGDLGFHNIQAGIAPDLNSNDETQTGKSLLGRLNYTLMGRYILTSSIRRDGFSAFGVNNQYGVYPAFAFAWRISEENFMKETGINDLKLRLSWGENGNRDIGTYAYLSRMNVTDNIIGGENVKGIWTNNLGNPNLRWERTRANNVGVDFSILNNRLSGSVDAYYNQTTDLILTRGLSDISGYLTVISNLGQVDNKGVELTLNSLNLDRRNVRWSSTFIYSTNKNTIKHLYGNMVDVKDAEGNVIGQREGDDILNGWYIGHGIHDIFYQKKIGIWQLGEEAEAAKYGKQPGDPRLLDLNDDGKITDEDKMWLGSRTPRFRMSLRNDLNLFDNFSLSFVLRGEFNYLGEDNLERNEDNRYFDRSNSIMTEYWTPENPSTQYARLGSNSSNPSVRIFKRRDFVRLQNAAISYNVPTQIIDNLSIRDLRLSLNVDNAFVITDWQYFDPENLGRAPRIFTLGLNVTL